MSLSSSLSFSPARSVVFPDRSVVGRRRWPPRERNTVALETLVARILRHSTEINGHHLRSFVLALPLVHVLSLVRSSPATMLDARRHGPHGARRRTHARTAIFTLREDVTRPRCERQRQHHHRTLSWRPSFSGIQWRYRESRNVKRTRVHGCKCARALRACERDWRCVLCKPRATR